MAKDLVNLVNYAKNATYTSHGALKTVLLGNDSGNAGSTLTQTFNKRLQPLTIHAANSTRTIIDLTYGFNLDTANNGNVVSITNNLVTGRNRSFTYDELNRVLTAATPAGPDAWSQSFEYDIWGNLKTITASGAPGLCVSVHPNNRLDSTFGGLTTYGHDSAGNLISEGTTTYTYNAENNLKTGGGVTFTYDGDGQRVGKSGHRLYWWGMNGALGLLAETWPDGTDKREYIFFAGRRIAVVDLSVSGGNCVGTPPNCARYYFYPDHLGSTSVLTSSSGNTTVHEADFHPFGGEKVITSSSINPHYRFTGKERDNETGLDYLLARYLGSNMGRFTSPDPVGGYQEDPQTLNRYVYVRNNPLRFTDPTGLDFYLACEVESATCKNGQVGTTAKDGTFTATVVSNDKNGNLVDQHGNTYTGTFDGKNVTLTQNGTDQSHTGEWKQGSNATAGIQGSGELGKFNFTFKDHGSAQKLFAEFTFQGSKEEASKALEKAGFKHWGTGFHFGRKEYRLPAKGRNSTHFNIANTIKDPNTNLPRTSGDMHTGEYYPGFKHFWEDVVRKKPQDD